jgi:hypothetical protein
MRYPVENGLGTSYPAEELHDFTRFFQTDV